eukprot:7055499-Lingulodinium_polyedra.AAC.1
MAARPQPLPPCAPPKTARHWQGALRRQGMPGMLCSASSGLQSTICLCASCHRGAHGAWPAPMWKAKPGPADPFAPSSCIPGADPGLQHSDSSLRHLDLAMRGWSSGQPPSRRACCSSWGRA